MLDDRFRTRWTSRLGSFAAFDPNDPRQVDALAGELLERFVAAGDVESFAMLCELTGPRLRRLAARIARRFELSQRPDLLVDELRRTLFERRDDAQLAFAQAHFLAWARERLLHRARELEGRHLAVEGRSAGVGGLPDGTGSGRPLGYNLYKLYKK